MRQVVLDTETTGLDPAQGHRVIEIGAVELVDRRQTGNHFHQYLQPDRTIDDGAFDVHGISNAFLADKPHFADVVDELIDFLRGAELIIHNAPFDVAFLDHELRLLGARLGCLQDHCSVLDTLALARQLHPGQKNSLDALCKRYEVDNSQRELHGALLDAEILADVYLAMTGGQAALDLTSAESGGGIDAEGSAGVDPGRRLGPLPVVRASAAELAAHHDRLEAIEARSGGNCLWKRLDP